MLNEQNWHDGRFFSCYRLANGAAEQHRKSVEEENEHSAKHGWTHRNPTEHRAVMVRMNDDDPLDWLLKHEPAAVVLGITYSNTRFSLPCGEYNEEEMYPVYAVDIDAWERFIAFCENSGDKYWKEIVEDDEVLGYVIRTDSVDSRDMRYIAFSGPNFYHIVFPDGESK